MIVHPNAKLNIGLDVMRKRPDGYHDLESLFVPCPALTDVLEMVEAPKFGIEIIREGRVMDGSAQGDWDPMKDLTVQAYRLLKKECDIPPVRIRLEKRIPVGAGLGGGSADAAFALRALSEMFDLYLPDEMLEIYAAGLGSDCPFFIYNSPMFVTGRGDVLEPFDMPALDGFDIKVEIPEGVSVSTREAYAGIVPRNLLSTSIAGERMPLREALLMPVDRWKEFVSNDFEKTVFSLYPEIAALKESMYVRGAVYASMSGSGSSVFGLFPKA